MSGAYRITVSGVMSERFCQGFHGLTHRAGSARTILSGDPRTGPPLHEVLASLDNLGLEVLSVEHPPGAAHTTPEA